MKLPELFLLEKEVLHLLNCDEDELDDDDDPNPGDYDSLRFAVTYIPISHGVHQIIKTLYITMHLEMKANFPRKDETYGKAVLLIVLQGKPPESKVLT